MHTSPYIFAISGVKNSGKTTFIENMIPIFHEKGMKVGVLKHDGHLFQADVSGTDSFRYLSAGADISLVYDSEKYMATVMETVTEQQLFSIFHDCNYVILEGFKNSFYPKFEIIRYGNSEKNVCVQDSLLGIISDFQPELDISVPLFNLNRPETVVNYVLSQSTETDKAFYADSKTMLFHEHYFFGPGVYMLFCEIMKQGSIRKAALTMQMSYSKAWKMVKRLEEETGKEFLIRNTGGKTGGSSVLTQTALSFMKAYELFEHDVKRETQEIFHRYFDSLL